MNSDLLRAVTSLKESSEYTCVLCKGEKICKSTEKGIKPLIEWVKADADFIGFSAADKIVGKAAAFLYVLLGVKEVYAEVMSEKAVEVFRIHCIPYSYGIFTKEIINRKGTRICPMEETVQYIYEPQEAFDALKEELKS